jgi:hypothetical protein
VRYPPNWQCLGKRAERLRNDFMLADSRPDFVVVFPGGRDTADLAAKGMAAGIRVLYAPARPAGKEAMEPGAAGGAGIPMEHTSTPSI